MEEEILEYLTNTSLLLNGQLRGFINEAARKENLQFIQFTMADVFEKGLIIGESKTREEFAIEKLKQHLKDGPENNTNGS